VRDERTHAQVILDREAGKQPLSGTCAIPVPLSRAAAWFADRALPWSWCHSSAGSRLKDYPQQRRLAGTVGAYDRDRFSRIDAHRYAEQG
jgi:hypothetical protein